MADEADQVLEEGQEPGAALEEGGQIDPNNDEGQSDPIEALASEMGWVPQDQFRGDPNDWRPAKDFIVKGREINQGLSRELRSVREEVSRMGRVSSQILADKIAERDAYWADQHARAVKAGDQELADRAVDERIKLKTAAPANDTPDVPGETQAWIQRNPWFNTDPLAKVRATELSNSLAQQGVPIDEQLRQVERAIRKEFPEHFPTANGKSGAAVQTGGSRKSAPVNREKGFNDMPQASQQMAADYERRHGIKKEDFAKSYWADQAKQESRRVG